MGPALINAMIPGLSDALRVSSDPILGQAIRALSGEKASRSSPAAGGPTKA